jgi:hypothetical protein
MKGLYKNHSSSGILEILKYLKIARICFEIKELD